MSLVETASFGVIAALLLASGIASAVVKRTFHSVMFLGVFLVAVAALYVLLGSPLVGVIQVLVYVGGILTLFVFAVMFVAGDESEIVEPEAPSKPRSNVWSILVAVGVAAGVLYLAVRSIGPANQAAANLLGGTSMVANLAGFAAGTLVVVALAIAGLVAWFGIRHAIDRWSVARLFGTGLAALILGLVLAVAANNGGAWGTQVGTDANQTQANDLDRVLDSLFGPNVVALEILGILLTAVMIGALVLARPLVGISDEDRYAHISRNQLRESQMASDVALHTGAAPPSPPTPAPAATTRVNAEVPE